MTKILIIDDSWISRKSIRAMLNTEEYELIEAEDGQQGLDEIVRQKPDCVILDLLMPVLDGFAVLEALRFKNDIPVIVLSANIQDTVREKVVALGAYDFLNKPPAREVLIDTVKMAISGQ